MIYLNADLLCDSSIYNIVIDNRVSNTAIQKIEWNEEAVNVTVSDSGEIIEIGKHIDKSSNHGEFIGIIKMTKSFAAELHETISSYGEIICGQKFAVDTINSVIKKNREKLFAMDVTDKIAIEIDTPDDYYKAQEVWKKYENDIKNNNIS
jgi:choline kinase